MLSVREGRFSYGRNSVVNRRSATPRASPPAPDRDPGRMKDTRRNPVISATLRTPTSRTTDPGTSARPASCQQTTCWQNSVSRRCATPSHGITRKGPTCRTSRGPTAVRVSARARHRARRQPRSFRTRADRWLVHLTLPATRAPISRTRTSRTKLSIGVRQRSVSVDGYRQQVSAARYATGTR